MKPSGIIRIEKEDLEECDLMLIESSLSYVGQPWRSLVDNSICQAPCGMLDLQAG